jgi:transposase
MPRAGNKISESLREQALRATHPRTRERFMALYEIAQGKSATQVGQETGRNPQTVMEWVHKYNHNGPKTLEYQRTGGHPPLYPNR